MPSKQQASIRCLFNNKWLSTWVINAWLSALISTVTLPTCCGEFIHLIQRAIIDFLLSAQHCVSCLYSWWGKLCFLIRRQNYFYVLGPVSSTPLCQLWMPNISMCVLKNLPMLGKGRWSRGCPESVIGTFVSMRPISVCLCWATVGDAFHLKTKSRNTVLGTCVLLHNTCPDGTKPSSAFTFAKWQYLQLFICPRFALARARVQLVQSIVWKVFLGTQKCSCV